MPDLPGISEFLVTPDPFGLGYGGDGDIDAYAQNTSGDNVRMTSQSTWNSDNTGVSTVVSAGVFYGAAAGSFNAQAQITLLDADADCPEGSHHPCPTDPWQDQSPRTVVRVQITSADITQDNVTVVLSGSSTVTGNLSVSLNGPSTVSLTVSLAQENNVGPGTKSYHFGRTSLAPGEYTSVTASWTAGNGANASASVSFNVLGVTRFSTYNALYESTCATGTAQTAYIITGSSGCSNYKTTLNPTFMSQVVENGTGVSNSNGILKTWNVNTGRCALSSLPSGATSSNTFYQVTTITGSCNTTLSGGTSVAANPNPNPSNATWQCGDQVMLINSSNQNNSTKTVQDYCPGCSTPGHIDSFSSSQACNVHLLPDYGNFYAIRLR